MFRLPLRPSPFGFALGVLVMALWALLWLWFFTQLLTVPQRSARRPGETPRMAQTQRAGPPLGSRPAQHDGGGPARA